MARTTVKILFICHGNICRSTMAQCVMQHMVDARGLGARIVVDSAATTYEEIGMPIYPPARDKLKAEGVPVVAHRARRIEEGEDRDWDYLICMDDENVRHLRRILGEGALSKVSKLLEHVGESGNVADPWYTGDFDATYRDVTRGCEALLAEIVDASD